MVADLFKPKTATRDRPAPLVVVVPGFQRSKEALAAVSIELSRRGMVVIATLATCLVFVMILLSNTVCYLPL